MAYPEKQSYLRIELARVLHEVGSGGKLPSERQLGAMLGAARRTVRKALDELERAGAVLRTARGTFACGERPVSASGEDEPLTVLVPCPDFMGASDYSSQHASAKLIRGAMRSAAGRGRRIITIPVSDSNDPDSINVAQLSHLHEYSNVLYAGTKWYRNVLPILAERRCRVGFIDNELYPIDILDEHDIEYFCYRSEDVSDYLPDAAEELRSMGSKRVAFFGVEAASVTKRGFASFRKDARAHGMDDPEALFMSFAADMPLAERLSMLRTSHRKLAFDGLILELWPYPEEDLSSVIDFYEKTGIPRRMPITITPGEATLQHGFDPGRVRVAHVPVERQARTLSSHLLDGDRGPVIYRNRYMFEPFDEFLEQQN